MERKYTFTFSNEFDFKSIAKFNNLLPNQEQIKYTFTWIWNPLLNQEEGEKKVTLSHLAMNSKSIAKLTNSFQIKSKENTLSHLAIDLVMDFAIHC